MTMEGAIIATHFRDGVRKSLKRTSTTGKEVCLLGSTIAHKDDAGVVWMTLAGYPTSTTRDRLNAICEAYGAPQRFRQCKHVQYYGDLPIGSWDSVPLAGPLGMQVLLLGNAD